MVRPGRRSSLLTALWFAALDGRRLEVHWPESAGVVDLAGAGVETTRRDSLDRLALDETYFKRTHGPFADALRLLATNATALGRRRDVVLSGNRGLTHVVFGDAVLRSALRRRGLDAPDAWLGAGCALHHITRPTRATFDAYVAPLLALTRKRSDTVCLHLRTGLMPELEHQQPCKDGGRCARPDDEMHGAARAITVDDVAAFVACAELAGGPGARWFVAADSESLRKSFLENFGNRVILAPWAPDPFASYQHKGGSRGGSSAAARRARSQPDAETPDAARAERHRMREALRRTFAEWYALAHCRHLVVSRSGFSRTAAVVARGLFNASIHYVSHLGAPQCDAAAAMPKGSQRASLLMTGGAGV
ncbi:hypothetical protein M885DRAFT_508414 [Pelagophyceae sp. CCMP2097]|nr:hypothetical protein M885DRAFT_508414 [Pelagophyceae sp. CCMP2097]